MTDSTTSTTTTTASATVLARIEQLIAPIVADLHMELYDLEFRGGTLRVTVDRTAGSDGGLDLDAIALASRLIGRELDHEDPVAGHYTLEVSSPGLERALRVPAHFTKVVGRTVAVRLRDLAEGEARRVHGVLVGADQHAATVRTDDGAEVVLPYDRIDRARTVFEWGPAPKPGKGTGTRRRQTDEKEEPR